MPLDFRNRRIGPLIGPYRVDRFRSAERNAVIGTVALVRAVSRMLTALEPTHVGILSGNVKDRRGTFLPPQQCGFSIRDFNLRYAHHNARAAQFNGYSGINSRERHNIFGASNSSHRPEEG